MPKRRREFARVPVIAGKGSAKVGHKHARRRLRGSWPLKLCLLAGSITIGLLLGELVVRLSGAAPDVIPIGVTSDENVYRRSTNPILSYEFKPGYRTDNEDVPAYCRRINSHGFRDVERQYEKPTRTKRVILLGDSVVVGYGMPELDQLMSRQLEELYENETVEVLNMAVTGYCTRAEIELLKTKGLKYDPDLVILVFVENDFRNFNPESLGSDGIAGRSAIVNSLFCHSHVFRTACLMFNWFDFGQEADPERWNQDALGDNNVNEGLRLFRELADEYEFTPVVAAWPGFTNDGIEYPEKMFLPGSNELIIERLAQAYGLHFVGLREPFVAHWQAQIPPPNARVHYTIGDEMHASAAGHRAAAEILQQLIEDHHLLDHPRSSTALARRTADAAESAIEAAKDLGKQKPEYGLVLLNKAIELRRNQELDKAVELLEEIVHSESMFVTDARMVLATIKGEQGKLSEAKGHLQKILDAEPEHVQAHLAMATASSSEDDTEQAISHLKRAVELRPELAQAHYRLGVLLAQRASWDESGKHLRLAVKLAPNNVDASNAWGMYLTRQRRFEEAKAQFRHSLKLDPTNELARRNLSRLPGALQLGL